MQYNQLISSLWNKRIYLKTSFTSGFGEILVMLFNFWYNNIKVGVIWCHSNLDTVCGVQSIFSALFLCSLKWKILVRRLYWVLITPKNFIFTPFGVIYPRSPTPALNQPAPNIWTFPLKTDTFYLTIVMEDTAPITLLLKWVSSNNLSESSTQVSPPFVFSRNYRHTAPYWHHTLDSSLQRKLLNYAVTWFNEHHFSSDRRIIFIPCSRSEKTPF
jgi:hypothetical protein